MDYLPQIANSCPYISSVFICPTFFVCLCDVSHVDDVMNKLYSFPELLMSRTGLASPTHPHLLAMR